MLNKTIMEQENQTKNVIIVRFGVGIEKTNDETERLFLG